jgi:hypothetical protein
MMKPKILLPALLLISILSAQVMANTTVGSTDCGQWTQKPSNPRKAWLLGFMSGLNFANPSRSDALNKLSSADQIIVWMDNYCKDNPLNDVAVGGRELYAELLKKK